MAERFVGGTGGIIVPPCSGCECMVKKVKSLWRKVDILISALRKTCKPRSASFLKSCRDAASATMFSSDGIQNAKTSMSNTAAIRRIVWRGWIASPLMDRLLIPSTTAVLSHARRNRPPAHYLWKRTKVWRIANISFQLICF